jgi:hypothetical protein
MMLPMWLKFLASTGKRRRPRRIRNFRPCPVTANQFVQAVPCTAVRGLVATRSVLLQRLEHDPVEVAP